MAGAGMVWIDLRIQLALPGNRLVRVRVDQTWNELFQAEFGIVIPGHFRVSNYLYRRGHPGGNGGYCGRLSEPITDFLRSFRTQRIFYKAIFFSMTTMRGPRRRDNQRAVVGRAQPQVHPPRANAQRLSRAMIQERLNRFQLPFLRRVRAEIAALQARGTWIRNVMRAPRASMFVTELLNM